MNYSNLYTSAACNMTHDCADLNAAGLLAYGSSCCLVVINTRSKGSNAQTYYKHKATVNCVKWVPEVDNQEQELVTGGEDCLAILWRHADPEKSRVLKGHTGAVVAVDALHLKGKVCVATASSDQSIRLWSVDCTGDAICTQTIDLISQLCLALRLQPLPGTSTTLLSFATTDNHINVYRNVSEDPMKFASAAVLTGHSNWVRGLDFIADNENNLLLASCSQDKCIRLWKIHSSPQNSHPIESKANIECTLASVLQGHEDWVYSVHWNKVGNHTQLLSCSTDKTMIIWSPGDDGIWYERVRVGTSEGNAPGFFGGKFSLDGSFIIAYGFFGSFYMWSKSSGNESSWMFSKFTEGHLAAVRDVCWAPQGQHLFSTSADQTTRVHGLSENQKSTWRIIARPQVHGFGIQCVVACDNLKFASGADEKVIRVFEAPRGELSSRTNAPTTQNPLRLSNKADDAVAEHSEDSLWPEVQKLYGHGNEIFSLACSSDGRLLASACKAFSADDSGIFLWNTSNWKIIQKLGCHKSTVTDLSFSNNCRFLLAVSKDRRWSLYETDSETSNYQIVAIMGTQTETHNRIIWSCCWSHDDVYFATSSRDGKLIVWNINSQNEPQIAAKFELSRQSITACAFAHRNISENSYLLAIGTETGTIKLLEFQPDIGLKELLALGEDHAHHMAVNKLKFRPNCNSIQLASCGNDSFVRLYEFQCL